MKADRTKLNVLFIGAWIMAVMAVVSSPARAQITFEPLREFPAGEFPFAITGGDYDGDGDIDVVVSEQLGGLNLLLGDGEGNFEPPIPIQAGYGVRLISIDIDNDGDLDVLGTQSLVGRLVVVENDGFGNLSVKAKIKTPFNSLIGIAAGDFDGDGDADVAVSTNAGFVLVFVNDGGGEYRGVDSVLAAVSGGGVNVAGNLVAADMDADGDLDLVGGINTDPEIMMLRNERDDSKKAQKLGVTFRFRAAQPGFTPNVQFGAYNLDVGDLDGDGDLDTFSVSGADFQPVQIQAALNNGSGGLTLGWMHPQLVLAENVRLADMDLDGDLDAVIADHAVGNTQDGINVFVNDGAANFTVDGLGWPSSSGLNSAPYDLFIADLDEDGDMDVVAPNNLSDTIGVLLNSTT